MLVSDLINESFLDLNEITVGRTIAPLEQADAFLRLNQLLAQWSNEQLIVPNVAHTPCTLSAGVSNYTLGTGGSLATAAKPIAVIGATSISGGFRGPVRVVSFAQFDIEAEDTLGSSSVLAKLLAADAASPSINLRVHPIPAAAPGTLWIDYWTALVAFGTVGDTVALPAGFEEALHHALALKLYPQYARPGTTDLAVLETLANNSKSSIIALNTLVLGKPAAPAAAQGN